MANDLYAATDNDSCNSTFANAADNGRTHHATTAISSIAIQYIGLSVRRFNIASGILLIFNQSYSKFRQKQTYDNFILRFDFSAYSNS